MILSDLFLHSPILKNITSKKFYSRKIQQLFTDTDLKKNIGLVERNNRLVQTTFKTDIYDQHQSEAFKQTSTSLGDLEAVTSQSITLHKILSNTTSSSRENTDTTHVTMTSNIVSALTNNRQDGDYHATNNRIMVLVLIGIFLFISLFITTVVVVMCRKKNSVFMLQKCEQESDLEMNDMDDANAENDTSESEYEALESVTDVKRSESYPCLGKLKYVHEPIFDRTHRKKTVDFNLFTKSRKSVDTQSPSSTPLLFNKNSGTGYNDFTQETSSEGIITNHSPDKQTASTSSDKLVISLDKFSLHRQQTDRDISNSSDKIISSRGKQKLFKSNTFDTCVRFKDKTSIQTVPSRKGKQPKKQSANSRHIIKGAKSSNTSDLQVQSRSQRTNKDETQQLIE